MATTLSPPFVGQAFNATSTPTAPPSPVAHHPAFKYSTRASLRVISEPSSPGEFPVTVVNGSDGKAVHLMAQGMDTVLQLKNQVNGEGGPELNVMNLAFNGKPVKEDQCLRELGAKAGAVFVTYRKCNGG